LLLLHGHITDPALVRRLAQSRPTPKPHGKPRPRLLRRLRNWLPAPVFAHGGVTAHCRRPV
jgi:hypothetical protein